MSIETTGVGDFAAITSSFPNKVGPLTVMGWFYMVSGPGSGNTRAMVTLADTGNDDAWDLEMQANVGDTIDKFGSYSSTGGDQIGTTAVSKSAWHNIAITISAGNVLKTYIDGTIDVSAGTHSTSITPTSLRLGRSSAGDDTWVGLRFYGLKIWNAELSGAEITAEQASYSPVRLTNRYGSWLLPNVTTLTDDSGNGHHFTRNSTNFQNAADPPPLSGGATVTAPKGTATATGFAPTTSAKVGVTAPKGTATGVGLTPSIASKVGITAPKGAATATGFAPSVSANAAFTITAPLGTATATGRTPTISSKVTLVAPLGSAVASGLAPVVSFPQGVTIVAPCGTAIASGKTPTISSGARLSQIETIEAAIVARLRDQVSYFSTPPGECRGINNVASVMTLATMTTPSALVAFAGEQAAPSESPITIGRADARLEWRWSIFVLAKSFTDFGEGRLGTTGAYQMIDDIVSALQGYGFGGTDTRLFYVGSKRFKVIDGRVLYEMTFRHHMIRLAA